MFEMWTLRRSMKISYFELTSNEELLRRAGVETHNLGHILRGYSVEEHQAGNKLQNIKDWRGVKDVATLFRRAKDNCLTYKLKCGQMIPYEHMGPEGI